MSVPMSAALRRRYVSRIPVSSSKQGMTTDSNGFLSPSRNGDSDLSTIGSLVGWRLMGVPCRSLARSLIASKCTCTIPAHEDHAGFILINSFPIRMFRQKHGQRLILLQQNCTNSVELQY